MSLFGAFRRPRKTPAQQAKERLQNVLAYDRREPVLPDFLPLLQRDLMGVIGRYVRIEANTVFMEIQIGEGVSTLAVNVSLPEQREVTVRYDSH